MSRISKKPIKDYPWYVKLLFKLQKRKYGKILESAKAWARSPKVFIALSTFFGAIERKSSPISPELRRLLILRVSEINSCAFCIGLNSDLYLKEGDAKKLTELTSFEKSSLFSEKEKAALSFAEAVTLKKVDEEIFQALRKHFTEDEVVEITAIIAFQNCSTLFNNALQIASETETQP